MNNVIILSYNVMHHDKDIRHWPSCLGWACKEPSRETESDIQDAVASMSTNEYSLQDKFVSDIGNIMFVNMYNVMSAFPWCSPNLADHIMHSAQQIKQSSTDNKIDFFCSVLNNYLPFWWRNDSASSAAACSSFSFKVLMRCSQEESGWLLT